MATKVLVLLAAIAAAAYASDTDCKCEPPSELEDSALWDFFKKLSEVPDVNDLDKRLDAALPGELSPLLECNCLEKTETRRKRKIQPEVIPELTEEDYNDEPEYEVKRTSRCPEGYAWFGIMCVDTKLLLEK